MNRRLAWAGACIGAAALLYALPSLAFISWLEAERWLTRRGK